MDIHILLWTINFPTGYFYSVRKKTVTSYKGEKVLKSKKLSKYYHVVCFGGKVMLLSQKSDLILNLIGIGLKIIQYPGTEIQGKNSAIHLFGCLNQEGTTFLT